MKALASYLLAAAALACTGLVSGKDPEPNAATTMDVASNREWPTTQERDSPEVDSPRMERQDRLDAPLPGTRWTPDTLPRKRITP